MVIVLKRGAKLIEIHLCKRSVSFLCVEELGVLANRRYD